MSGTNADLRERLIRISEGWYLSDESRALHADAVLTEIAASGYELVATDRVERLIGGAARATALLASDHAGMIQAAMDELGIGPGDLDPIEGGAE